MDSITIHPQSKEQISLFKQMAKALKIPFEIRAELTERQKAIELYGKDLVEKIERGEEDYKRGKCVEVNLDDLWK